ncbi:MAG: hypothetical protein HY362_03420 [Candidatus Aenigmarchaeota archaeon]|nr:hypothetical protein [Candidatus Aenigmarchaeota archaeon]
MPVFADIPGAGAVELAVGMSGSSWNDIHSYSDPQRVPIDPSLSINAVLRSLKRDRPNYSALIRYGANPRLITDIFSEANLAQAFEELYQGMLKNCIFAELCKPDGQGNTELYRGAIFVGGKFDISGLTPVVLKTPKARDKITPEWREALGADEAAVHDPSPDGKTDYTVLLWNFSETREPWLLSYPTPFLKKHRRGTLFGRRVAPASL